jgi:hypothetical protein
MSLRDAACTGADTILVLPTLAYCALIWAEVVNPLVNFSNILETGLLEQALTDASLIVRLLNDMGYLVAQSVEEQTLLVNALKLDYSASKENTTTISNLLLEINSQFKPWLTRLYKDIVLGESNLVLNRIFDTLDVLHAIKVFQDRITFYSNQYIEACSRLTVFLDAINDYMGDTSVSRIIMRFVEFHQALYQNPFDDESGAGDYTV